jgi:hypothetical protein
MKRLAIILTLFCHNLVADTSGLNLQLPSMGSSYQSDRIRSGDMECQNAIGGATMVETGVTTVISNLTSPFDSEDPNNPQSNNLGLYARIIIPLDAPRERINCNSFYRLEMRRKQLELEKLEAELQNLKRLQKQAFEN